MVDTNVRNFGDLSGRVAVVIGGATGLGLAAALALAEAGADVVPTSRRPAVVDEACAAVEARGRRTRRHPVDLADRAALEALRDDVVAALGRVDILVNAAGRTARAATATFDEATWDAILDTNVTGMLRACQVFYPALARHGRGRIVNFASLSSFVAFHEVTAYGVSKAGVLALTRNLGAEWATQGITVNAIVPGVFRTALNAALLDESPRGRELLMRTPMRRFGQAEEIGPAVVFLASDGARFITGQSLVVDGGFLASGVNS